MQKIDCEIDGHELSLIKYEGIPSELIMFLDDHLITFINTELAFKILYNFAESMMDDDIE